MTNFIAISNVSEGTFEQRLMTDDELNQDELNREEAAAITAAQSEAADKIAAAKAALLEKLGITEDEAKLLFGGN